MKYAIKIVGLSGQITRSTGAGPEGQFIKSYDPDAHGGRGDVAGTFDESEALKFDTADQAMACYAQPSKVKPTRPDGRPNCPLRAFTVEIVQVSG